MASLSSPANAEYAVGDDALRPRTVTRAALMVLATMCLSLVALSLLSLSPVLPSADAQEPQTTITVDNRDAATSLTGQWGISSGTGPVGVDSLWCNADCTFTWSPNLPAAETYEVFTWYTPHPNRATAVPYTVDHAGGSTTVLVNQQLLTNQWVSLGTWQFPAGDTAITVSAQNGQANADAVQLRLIDDNAPSVPAGLGEVATTSSSVELAWLPSTDDISVQGYSVYRDDVLVGSTSHPTTAFVDSGLAPATSYTYRVAARDSGGNESSLSAPYTATTRTAPIGGDANVVINELVAANDSYFDAFGDTPDWIELKNIGTAAADLAGWSITDDGASWTFPATSLPAGGRLLLFASGRDLSSPQLHTNFSLKRGGETVTITNAAAAVVDSVTYPGLDDDVSYGRANDGASLGVLLSATPLITNTGLAPSQVTITTPAQTFQNVVTVEMASTTRPGEVVRYTTNGNDISASSPIYNGPFDVNESTVVRAAVVDANGAVGPEASAAFVAIDGSLATVSSDLPLVLVQASGEIDNTGDQDAIISVIDRAGNGRAAATDPIDYAGFAGLRVRGASSVFFPKKQYKLELWNDRSGDEVDFDLLGLGKESDWGLYAPGRYDRAMINNSFMYELGKRTGVPAPDFQFVEVYLQTNPDTPLASSDYLGLFLLRETIEIDKERVDIDRHNQVTAGDDGGYILRYDWTDNCCSNIERTRFGSYVAIDSPKASAITPGQFSYASGWWGELSSAAATSFEQADGYIDFDSIIDHWLLEILALDVDVLRASHYLHKGAGGQLQGGPLWDYDRALGGADVRVDSLAEAQAWTPNGNSGHSYEADVYEDLWALPQVQARLRARWAELRQPGAVLSDTELESLIFSMGGEIAEAYVREDARWGNVDGYGSRFGDLNGELSHMRDWVLTRTGWLDGQFLTTSAPPVLTLPTNGIEIASNTLVNYQVQASDDQTLVYAAAGLPKGLTLDSSTGVISGLVAFGDLIGPASVDITVTDSQGASTSGTLVISDPEFPVDFASDVILNEFNAVAAGKFLDDGGSDTTFGRIPGNGGDWFEVVTISDNLDLRGWTFDLFSNNDDGESVLDSSLVLGNDSRLADLRAGTIITVAESVADELFYDPATNDWTLNLQANDAQDGALWASQSDFDTNNSRWRLVIRDSAGTLRGAVAGETEPIVNAGASVNGGEILTLAEDPSASPTPTSYDDGTSSTFGAPNPVAGGDVQDFSALRPPPPDPVDPGVILNEWNAVSSTNLVSNGDTFFGDVAGNGGDWFELVVVEDRLDLRGWQLQISDTADLAPQVTDTFVFADDPLLADLRAGTIITVSEDLADDVSFQPATGDWWINLQAASSDDGAYFTADSQSNFNTNNDDWQLRIIDNEGVTRFGPAGEGIAGLSGVSSSEVGHLPVSPSDQVTPASGYTDSDTSTFGSPNQSTGSVQDFDVLRSWFVPEANPPNSVLTSPTTDQEFLTSTVLIAGITTDDTAVQSVQFSVEDTAGLFLQQDGTFANVDSTLQAELVTPQGLETDWSAELVLPDGQYELVVTAIDVLDNAATSISRSFSVSTADSEPPTVPGGLNGSSTSSTITISWTPSTDNVGVQTYSVFRDGEPAGSVAHPSTTFVADDLAPDTSYLFEVAAVDVAGNTSGRSTSVLVTTAPAPDVAALSEVPDAGWQTNGVVNSVLTVGDSIYIGGDFTQLTDAAGTTVARNNLAAVDRLTGTALAFDPDLNNAVFAMTASPDQTTVFATGSFTTSGTETRKRVAAFDVATGELTAFSPPFPNRLVQAVATDGEKLYVGGLFTKVGTLERSRLAAYDLATATIDLDWAPTAAAAVNDLIVDGAQVLVAGNFATINGVASKGLAVLDASDGSLQLGDLVSFSVFDIDVLGDQVLIAGNKRAAAFNRSLGSFDWSYWTNGTLRSVDTAGGYVYFGGNQTRMRGADVSNLTRFDLATSQLDEAWLPTIDGDRGVRSIAAADTQVVVGGDFATIAGAAHVGLAAFSESTGQFAPNLLTLTMLDNDQNGFVDAIEAVYDTELNPCAAPCTDGWNLTGVPSGGTLAQVSVTGSVITLELAEGAGAANTALGSLRVELGNASEITSVDGASITLPPTTPDDGASPALLRYYKTNAGVEGMADEGDRLVTVWSEELLPGSLPTTADVVLRDIDGPANDELVVDGYLEPMDLGADDFLTCADGPDGCGELEAIFPGSTLEVAGNGKRVTLTLSACSSGCAELSQTAASSTMTYVAPTSITDVAGNSAVGQVTKTFRIF